jgi:SAM-dependent methyltransferase
MSRNPYDEVPYASVPIEWTAPERLALASRLHGGPRPRLEGYRALEIGCGAGNNLVPLAFFRPHASFVGVDGAETAIARARAFAGSVDVTNVAFVHATIDEIDEIDAVDDGAADVEGTFDYIIAHGVFSWVPERSASALLSLGETRLAADGLLYLNYNVRPGWNVRGVVRRFLCEQTTLAEGLAARAARLAARAERAREIATVLAELMGTQDHPYATLMANELGLVRDADLSYIAHEYLAPTNRAYWRREFLELARGHGLVPVADADHNRDSGRLPDGLGEWLGEHGIDEDALEEAIDVVAYRQHHAVVLARAPVESVAFSEIELASYSLASCLEPVGTDEEGILYRHVHGTEATVYKEPLRRALDELRPRWPHARPIGKLFDDVSAIAEDLQLLHENGLVELRLPGSVPPPARDAEKLHRVERQYGYETSPYHTRHEA